MTNSSKEADNFQINFLPVGCGDAITIRFKGDDGLFHNILIDSGYKTRTYDSVLKPALKRIVEREETIDLWVITHSDADHIGGLLAFIADKDFKNELDFVKQYWFNWSTIELPSNNDDISVKQGIKLRDYLISIGRHDGKYIMNTFDPFYFFGVKISILSPDLDRFNKSKIAWLNEEKKTISAKGDYDFTIEELLKEKFKEDDAEFNGGSIAFLWESNGKRVLFLADSHPSVIVAALKAEPFNCSKKNPLKVDLVKVSHHGSSGNTCPKLLELIDCQDFVFCVASPNKHGLPNKQTMARIIASRQNADTVTNLYFNDRTPQYKDIFKVDKDAEMRFNFKFWYLPNGAYTFNVKI
jgi:beta-lactamase superfamily II metal-dependent hydrolase